MKTRRRKARELALQTLYQLDVRKKISDISEPTRIVEHLAQDSSVSDFAFRVVEGVRASIADLDKLLESFSVNWKLERMSLIDRNLLRIGVYELRYCQDIPATVTINEMVELAKVFGSEDSAAFVNGVLDKIKSTLDLAGKTP